MKKGKSTIILKDYMAYVISILVIVVSVCLTLLLPVSDAIKAYFSLPGIAGLFSLLVQGWRDQVAHERALELQNKQHDFDLAVASHMANVVFDKQVEFCEQYSQKIYSFIPKMFVSGPSKEALVCATELQDIRLRYSPWISLSVISKLTPYEGALREIGSLKMIEDVHETQKGVGDPNLIVRMDKVFMKFLGITESEITTNAADAILGHLKDVLNVTDLEDMRHRAVQLARQDLA